MFKSDGTSLQQVHKSHKIEKDEDCFVLESYLIDQYQGDMRCDKKLYWKDNRFLSTFRLPYQHELRFLKLNLRNKTSFKKYKFTSKDFLSRWDKHYISVDKRNNEITFNLRKSFKIKCSNSKILTEISIKDEVLTSEDMPFHNYQYLDQAEFKEKDEYGMQSFVIVGKNNLDRPIIATSTCTQKDTTVTDKMYWLIFQKILDFKDWPRQR
ncbi:MAG: hypothetical protein ACI85Q_001823 [Salibacteraceae bacterium]